MTVDCLGFDGYVTVTNDGPTVAGGSIAFRADLYYEDGSRPTGTFDYIWRDNGIPSHSQVVSFLLIRYVLFLAFNY